MLSESFLGHKLLPLEDTANKLNSTNLNKDEEYSIEMFLLVFSMYTYLDKEQVDNMLKKLMIPKHYLTEVRLIVERHESVIYKYECGVLKSFAEHINVDGTLETAIKIIYGTYNETVTDSAELRGMEGLMESEGMVRGETETVLRIIQAFYNSTAFTKEDKERMRKLSTYKKINIVDRFGCRINLTDFIYKTVVAREEENANIQMTLF